ncbi:MAG: hypothetical protein MK135_04310, partial [Polyangiaceae bacterium]|nr:hypothetical protein [Polyangiaceae bacterium]
MMKKLLISGLAAGLVIGVAGCNGTTEPALDQVRQGFELCGALQTFSAWKGSIDQGSIYEHNKLVFECKNANLCNNSSRSYYEPGVYEGYDDDGYAIDWKDAWQIVDGCAEDITVSVDKTYVAECSGKAKPVRATVQAPKIGVDTREVESSHVILKVFKGTSSTPYYETSVFCDANDIDNLRCAPLFRFPIDESGTFNFVVEVEVHYGGLTWHFDDWSHTRTVNLGLRTGTVGCPIGTDDGDNCYVATPPPGTSAVVQGSNLLATTTPSTDCPSGSNYDGANCLFLDPPAGFDPFIYEGKLYTEPQPGTDCPNGTNYDGANCFVMDPQNLEPFIWENKLYTEPGPSTDCAPGSFYDGANCFVMDPLNLEPFIWENKLYTEPGPSTDCAPGS